MYRHNLLERVAPPRRKLDCCKVKEGAEIHSARYVIYTEAIQDTSSQVNLALDPTSSYNCYWIPLLIGISRQKFFGLLYCFLNPYRKLQRRPYWWRLYQSQVITGRETCRHMQYRASSAIPTSSLRVPFQHRSIDTTVHASASNILLGIWTLFSSIRSTCTAVLHLCILCIPY